MRIGLLPALAVVLAACGSPKSSPPASPDAAVAVVAPAAPDAGVPRTVAELRPLVDAAARPLVDGGWTPALVVALIDEQGDTFLTYGQLRPDGPPTDADTIFEIGSVTQVFTSLVFAQLAENKVVKPFEPLEALLPKGTKLPEHEGQKISLVDLATHTSGLPRLPDLGGGDASNPYAHYDAARLYAFLARYTLPLPPGKIYDYSNLGAGLLGHALSLRAGIPYERLVVDGIARPLGMGSTFIEVPKAARARLAQGHESHGDPVPAWSFGVLAPAGALRSTARDMARFVRAQMDLLPDDDARRLRKPIELSQIPRADRPGGKIGLGWLTFANGQVYGHSGETGGFYTFVLFDLARKQGVVVLASGASPNVEKLGAYVFQSWLGAPATPPEVPSTVVLDAAALDAYAGVYDIAKDISIKVWREGNHLRAQPSGQGPDSLWAIAPDKFHLRKVDAQVEFERDPEGKVVALKLVEEAETQRAPRR